MGAVPRAAAITSRIGLLVRRDETVNADGFAYIYRHQVFAKFHGATVALWHKRKGLARRGVEV